MELRSINSGAEAAGRTALTEDEETRFRALEEEYESVKRNLRVAAMNEEITDSDLRAISDYAREFRVTNEKKKSGAAFRDLLNAGVKTTVQMELRSTGAIGVADVAGIIPVTIGDFIDPLEKGLILDKLGIKMLSEEEFEALIASAPIPTSQPESEVEPAPEPTPEPTSAQPAMPVQGELF